MHQKPLSLLRHRHRVDAVDASMSDGLRLFMMPQLMCRPTG
jgi:hypothetical protein